MDAEFFRTLYDYGFWARDRLLGAAAGMSDEDYAKPNGFTYGSLRGILTHVLGAESGYLTRWQGQSPTPITQDDVPTLESITERWRALEERMRSYLLTVKDEDLTHEMVSKRRDGSEFRRPLWQDLAQIANHGTQHRSEAAEALTMVGRSPGNMDLSVYFVDMAALTGGRGGG